MLELMLDHLGDVLNREMGAFLGQGGLVNVKNINESADSYRRVMQKYIEPNFPAQRIEEM